jgi:hypothetical protein
VMGACSGNIPRRTDRAFRFSQRTGYETSNESNVRAADGRGPRRCSSGLALKGLRAGDGSGPGAGLCVGRRCDLHRGMRIDVCLRLWIEVCDSVWIDR